MGTYHFSNYIALVVDDNRSIRDFTKSYLISMGFERVRTAQGSQQAKLLLEEENFDLILSDAVMPGLDGLGLLAFVRGNPETSTIPFIMISGFPEQAVTDALAGGVTDFILKPFSFDVFSKKIESAMQGKEPVRKKMQEPLLEDEVPKAPEVVLREKEVPLSDLVLAKYGAQKISHCRYIQGKKSGGFVSVIIQDEGVTLTQVEQVLMESAENRIDKVVVLAKCFESGLFSNAVPYAKSRGLDLTLKHIIQDSEGLVIGFLPLTCINLVSNVKEGKISFQLTSFIIADADAVIKNYARTENVPAVLIDRANTTYAEKVRDNTVMTESSWQSLISYWGVNLKYIESQNVCDFALDWNSLSCAGPKWQSPWFEIADQPGEIALLVVDILGNTSVKIVEIPGRA